MAKKNFYAAVFKDGAHRIYSNWPDCQRATTGVPDIKFKGFATREEAKAWIAMAHPGGASPAAAIALSGDEGSGAYPPGTVLIYVDGSYIHSRCKRAGWAWLAVRDGQIIGQESGVTERDALSRNIDGELEAAIRAMEWAHGLGHKAVIHHDYSGIAMWASGAWKVKAEVSLDYVERIREIKGAVTFKKVAGHSGDKYNDMVDKLAGEAIAAHADKEKIRQENK
jgi:ribonuclease H-related protein